MPLDACAMFYGLFAVLLAPFPVALLVLVPVDTVCFTGTKTIFALLPSGFTARVDASYGNSSIFKVPWIL